ncbi:NYN domain-containing protein [Derxia lacustris]|uniref:NYN domain-containing protein n=1 Tax=Derxia lacustris TaxID=764842 RepID=UPI00159337C9|nr:NYN domain-containing protein [Derxia lacustris]
MIFVDGENLAIRFKNLIESNKISQSDHVINEPNIYVWSRIQFWHHHANCSFIRSHYYTCARADDSRIDQISDELRNLGITDPRVFKKKSNGRSKRVDITLATEMLSHAHNGNYEIAVLVAGDDDYVPLVREIKRMGKQVALWFLEDGLSKDLRRECDLFFNLSDYLGRPSNWVHERF